MKKINHFKKLFTLFLLTTFLATACSGAQPADAPQTDTIQTDAAQTEAEVSEVGENQNQSQEAATEGVTDESLKSDTLAADAGDDTVLPSDTMEVHFIDIGQGDATLIKCGEHAMLIDAGENDMGTKVQLYLQKQGVKTLDYVIGTHPDSDHIGGLDVIIYKFDCSTIMMSEYAKDTKTYDDVIQSMKSKSYQNTAPVVGDQYGLGEAQFTIIAPNNYNYGNESNNYSIGLLLKHGNNTFIFTGDAEEEAEKDIAANGMDISADVYQVGHHGSATASSQIFLDAVKPTYAVISCGADNSYGHPHAETLNKLRAMGVKVFRTDEQGSIVASSDGNEITWNCPPSETWQAGENVKNSAAQSKKDNSTASSTEKATDNSAITETPAPVIEQPEAAPSTAQTYICNTNTKKFHYPTCASVGQMKEKNKQEVTCSREDVISMGYVPCKKCNP